MNTKFSEMMVALIGVVIFAAMFNFILINWALGCGETIYTATGSHPGECIGVLDLFRY